VARQLKLSVHQVEALEAGEFQRLPGAVFVRGFVRNYARLLKLDAESLLRSVAECLPREEPRPAAPPSQDIPFPAAAPRRWPLLLAALAGTIAVALAGYELLLSDPPVVPASKAALPSAPGAQPAAPAAQPSPPGALAVQQPDTSPPLPAAVADPPSGQPGAALPGTTPGAIPAATVGAEAAPGPAGGAGQRDAEALPAPGERQVRLVFDQESWVEIRDRGGRLIFSQLNRAGTEQRVNGQPPLSIIVGNAHGVRLTYEERPVNLAPHTKVDVARLTLE